MKHDAKPGYCSTTLHAGNCTLGDAGILLGVSSLRNCMARCLQECSRCAVVSWSATNRDCSWYAECSLDDLRRPPLEAPDYVSVRVRAAPAALPPPPSVGARHPLSLIIATLAVDLPSSAGGGGKQHGAAGGIGCALVLWCERAHRMATALRLGLGWNVSLVLMGDSEESLANCRAGIGSNDHGGGGVRVQTRPIDTQVSATLRAMREAPLDGAARPCAAAGNVNLLKWGAVGMVEADLVLFADIDIDLMPSNDASAAIQRWGEMAPALLRSNTRFVANADAMSPVNGGLWLVRPSRAAFNNGLRTLRRCRWNRTHGWEGVGPPRSLDVRPRHADGTALTGDVGDLPERSDAYRSNHWGFVNGDADQGFFWYWWFLRKPLGAYFRYGANRGHLVLHWRAWPKPWAIGAEGGYRHRDSPDLGAISPWQRSYAYAYLRDLSVPRTATLTATSECAHELKSLRRAIEDSDGFYDLPATRLGSAVPYFALW